MNTRIRIAILFLIAGLAGSLCAQTLTNLGVTAPTPGANDISQLSTSGNTTWPDGINYFSNNNPPVGQTFTTGTNALNLASIAIKTAGLNHDSNYGNPSLTPTYYLRIYSVSGSTATLLATLSAANPGFTDGNWLKWSGLNVPLGTNQTYAFTFGIPNDSSWVALAVCSANAYTGGEIVTIPTGGGAVVTGSSHTFDAVFDLGLVVPTTPSVGAVTVSPTTNVFAGYQMTFTAMVAGATPLYYQWQFNSGGGFVNLSGANTNPLSFVAAVTNTGSYRLVLTNSYGAVTSAPVSLTVRPGITNAAMPLPMPTYGWNLGNTLEATWGVPSFTAAPFNTASNAGFNAVRIPCAWDFNSTTNVSGGVTNYVINPTFMAQVKQAVDWAIGAGMYVMINDHWDGGWLENNIGTNVDATINAKMKSYWTQIATNFAGYDNHLLFAGANEPNAFNAPQMTTLMYYYQTFVNAVRATGGNNTNRWLVLQSITDPTLMNALPTDTVSNRLMVEYHQYTPSLFCFIHDDPSWGTSIYFWGKAYHYSGNPSRNATFGEENEIDSYHQQLNDLYVSKGIPVLIGELGAWAAPLTNATEATWNTASASYWNKYVVESARGHGLSPFYWSTASSIFDWTTGAINDAQRIFVLTGGAAPPPPNGAPYAPSDLTTIASSNQIILSWTAGSGATSYNLYRSTQSGSESTVAPVITGITGTSYTNTGLSGGTTYYYQVAGVSNSLASGFSPEVRVTTSGTSTTDPAQFNFEASVQNWTGGGGIVSGVATSATQKFSGNQSLAVNFTGGAAGTASPNVGNIAINPGTTITIRVWIPSGSTVTALQPYLMDQNWSWTSAWYGSFTPNAWNTITLTVPSNAPTPLNALGVQFITSGAWTGTCYIDSVSWPVSGPDFSVTANPTSLTVNAGSSGTSTVTVTPLNGLNAIYTLSVSNLPSGVSATFTNNPIIAGTSMLTLTASNSVVSGTTNVTVIARAGLLTQTKTIALTLTAPTNTPPTLDPIPNQTVNVGQIVAFTANATDTNTPPQTLTFSLLSGPANATLNTNSGAFSFRPLVTQADSTNNFTLKVSDNGTPSLSATQSFAVVVNPLVAPSVSNVFVAGGQFSFSIGGQSGPDYAVETSTNLTQWSNVFITNSPVLPFTWTDTNAAGPQRFYRIKLGPPLP